MSVLKVNHLNKNYGNKSVLQAISFVINEGDVIGLVGPNGAGKSTLMRSILALENVESGSVTIKDISNRNPEFFKYVSFLPSDNYLYTQLTGYDHLAFVGNIYNIEKSRIDEVIDLIGIRTYVNQPVKSYSYGMRQHLLIALSILTKPLVILMDEPFNGLDPTSIIELKQLIRTLHTQGIGILISTHNLDILEDLTNTIWFIKDGELFKNEMLLDVNDPYQIEVSGSFEKTVEQLMTDSHLPFQVIENRILTDPTYDVEKYLECLIKNGVQIKSVNKSKKNLEEMYKSFYEVNIP
ncbi:ABC transporter ATP-binding protein [Sporosarcina limicola]|uniref:ABC-2 type transport system ATP-binding protein n=1 Tax=Sporosarcina limicola TaxID=34101 RepID=A0A927MJL1_9BACL|nr:ABC transporter ATP-binding protein [Sporosarcina limicola]MBE1555919.1 ABC-2 type transport system ATP-binding protein [Sporosarcina limicola]